MPRAMLRVLALSVPLFMCASSSPVHAAPEARHDGKITRTCAQCEGAAGSGIAPGRAPGARTPGGKGAASRTSAAALEATVPQLTYSQSELFTEIGGVYGASAPDFHGTAFWYKGHLGVVYSQGEQEGGISLFDISNPRAPRLVGKGYDARQREGHTTAIIETAAGQMLVGLASNGLNLWDLNDPTKPTLYKNIPLADVRASDYDFGAWWVAAQAPYLYVSGSFNGVYIVDLSDLENPRTVDVVSMGSAFRTGALFAVGNLLTVSISDGGQIRLYDIGNPDEPVLLKEFEQVQRSYATHFNGGLIYGAMKVGGIEVIDVNDPLNPETLSDTFAYGVGAYVMIQDHYAHLGNSSGYAMLDISDPEEPVVVGTGHISGDNDFVFPLGNLVALGDDHETGEDNVGTRFLPTATGPDRIPPEVNFVSPTDGIDWIPVTARVGVTLTEPILVSSVTDDTFQLKRPDGTAVPGTLSIQQDKINFFPDAPLEVDTSYELVVPAGGLADLSGNRIAATFRSTFKTGPELVNPPHANAGEDVTGFVSEAVLLDPGRTLGGSGALEYSWDPGDGTPASAFSPVATETHVYTRPGHYTAILTVRDGRGQRSTDTSRVTVTYRPLATPPAHSGTILFDEANLRVWTVNPDAGTVAAIDTDQLALEREIPVGRHPTSIALAADETVWVVSQESAELSMIDALTLTERDRIPLAPGSRPYGVVADPLQDLVYVSLEGLGQVVALDGTSGAPVWTTPVGAAPRGLGVLEESIFVTRFISPADHAEVIELDRNTGAPLQTWILPADPGPDSELTARGVPNYLSQIVPSPDGEWLFVPSVKQNTLRGTFRDGQPLTFETTNRAILSMLEVATGEEALERRIDFDNRDHASAVALSELGDYAFVALQGSQEVLVMDLLSGEKRASIPHAGLAPQGLVATPDGMLFVQNFLGRDVTVYDLSALADSSHLERVAAIRTVGTEPLSAEVLLGKRIFYNASDVRMSRDSYMSCAGCHLDGGADRRVWDFTDRGEGLRRTTTLRGRGGMLHGPVHWSANFDEIQDFENDIRNAFEGRGFLADADWAAGTRSSTLGDKKAGLSLELDALSAYVSSLSEADPSPYRAADGTLTAAAKRGRDLFNSAEVGCASCHAGPHFTDSVLAIDPSKYVLHDVGTLTAASGKRMGQTLTGIDTPTLKGVWNNAPYLHDGSAATLRDVLVTRNPAGKHGKVAQLSSSQLSDLEAYVLSIDARSGAPVVVDMMPRDGQKLKTARQVSVVFSSYVDPATVTGSSFQVLKGTTAVAGTLAVARDRVTFTPSASLGYGAYTVKVTSAVKSVDGDAAVGVAKGFELAEMPLVTNLKVASSRASSYSLATNLRLGAQPYGDNGEQILKMPKGYKGLQYLKTAARDQLESRPALVSFELTAPAKVYVAFDRTLNPLPGWAADFQPTNERIIVSNEDYTPHRVWVATFPAGKVFLGGPRADGGEYSKVNYFVFFQPVE